MIILECELHNCELICAGIENNEHTWRCPIDNEVLLSFAAYHNRVDTVCCKKCKLRWELTSKEDDDNGNFTEKISDQEIVLEKS